ncbi:MAG: DUF2240 family protein [Poseidonia sp.]
MSDDVDDVRRALTIVFRGVESVARADLERMFSFDMEWVAPHEAENVTSALESAGWLVESNGQLRLGVELGEVDVPFGWFPRPARLMRPVAATSTQNSGDDLAPTDSSPPVQPTPAAQSEPEALSGDPRARLTKRVARFISRQSGLSMDELHRRAERKTRAFHLITPWMAYALVAREQGLVMDDIVQALDVV